MTKENPRLGYKCFYGDKTADIYAESLYDAKVKAIQHFRAPKTKQHMVTCVLAEKDGEPVYQSTSAL